MNNQGYVLITVVVFAICFALSVIMRRKGTVSLTPVSSTPNTGTVEMRRSPRTKLELKLSRIEYFRIIVGITILIALGPGLIGMGGYYSVKLGGYEKGHTNLLICAFVAGLLTTLLFIFRNLVLLSTKVTFGPVVVEQALTKKRIWLPNQIAFFSKRKDEVDFYNLWGQRSLTAELRRVENSLGLVSWCEENLIPVGSQPYQSFDSFPNAEVPPQLVGEFKAAQLMIWKSHSSERLLWVFAIVVSLLFGTQILPYILLVPCIPILLFALWAFVLSEAKNFPVVKNLKIHSAHLEFEYLDSKRYPSQTVQYSRIKACADNYYTTYPRGNTYHHIRGLDIFDENGTTIAILPKNLNSFSEIRAWLANIRPYEAVVVPRVP